MTRFAPSLFGGVFALLLLAGCDSKAPKVDAMATPPPQPSPAAAVPGGESGTPTSALPDGLKNDAYAWYGLGQSQPLDYVLTQSNSGKSFTGSAQVKLVKVDGNEATFEIDRTGGLGDELGNDTLALKPDGIYDVSNTLLKFKGQQLEFPNTLTPGSKWVSAFKGAADGQNSDQSMTFRVVGPSTFVSKKGKSYPALQVEGSGKVQIGGNSGVADLKLLFVKNIGLVKNQTTVTFSGKKPVVIHMVWDDTNFKEKP